MAAVRYRTRIATLLDRIMTDRGTARIANIDKSRVIEIVGVSRQTFYNWWKADSDDPEDFLFSYDPETERKFRLFFEELYGEPVQVIERIVLDPKRQESGTVAISATL